MTWQVHIILLSCFHFPFHVFPLKRWLWSARENSIVVVGIRGQSSISSSPNETRIQCWRKYNMYQVKGWRKASSEMRCHQREAKLTQCNSRIPRWTTEEKTNLFLKASPALRWAFAHSPLRRAARHYPEPASDVTVCTVTIHETVSSSAQTYDFCLTQEITLWNTHLNFSIWHSDFQAHNPFPSLFLLLPFHSLLVTS